MKRFLIALILAAIALPALAEDRTLFNENDTWNLYTTLEADYVKVGTDHGFMGGVEVGGILNEKFSAGLAYYTLLNEVEPGFNGYNNPHEFDIWYAGLLLDYTVYSHALVHASVSGFAGGGVMRLDRISDGKDKDVQLFVLEPAFNVMVNVTQAAELGVGLSYRHIDTYSSTIDGLSSGDMSGPVVSLFLRLTEF